MMVKTSSWFKTFQGLKTKGLILSRLRRRHYNICRLSR